MALFIVIILLVSCLFSPLKQNLIKSQKEEMLFFFSHFEEEKTIFIHEISGKAVKRVFGSGA